MKSTTFSFPELRDNLTAKLEDTQFRRDLDALVSGIPSAYDPDTAADRNSAVVCVTRPQSMRSARCALLGRTASENTTR